MLPVGISDYFGTTGVRDGACGQESAYPGTCRCNGGCCRLGATQEDCSNTTGSSQRPHTFSAGALPRGVTESGVCRVQNQG